MKVSGIPAPLSLHPHSSRHPSVAWTSLSDARGILPSCQYASQPHCRCNPRQHPDASCCPERRTGVQIRVRLLLIRPLGEAVVLPESALPPIAEHLQPCSPKPAPKAHPRTPVNPLQLPAFLLNLSGMRVQTSLKIKNSIVGELVSSPVLPRRADFAAKGVQAALRPLALGSSRPRSEAKRFLPAALA